jgi:phage terminase large subunit
MNEATTVPGLEALAAYHAKVDAQRGIDLGPDHDWASHDADAWGLMCVHCQEQSAPNYRRTKTRPNQSAMTA